MNPVLVGITGPARSGKDTAAQLLHASWGGYIYALAEPLKLMLAAGLGVDMRQKYWQDKKEQLIPAIGRSPRQLMQTLGTEWGRQLVSEDLWLVLAAAQLRTRGAGMIIPDVRFENEAAWIRARGGTILHLRRKDAEQVNPHQSEAGVAHVPGEVVISNDATIVDLQEQIDELVAGWREL
jgi:hypothetical protein